MEPDLMDRGGRMRRIILALIVGSAAAALGYWIADTLARPDEMHADGVYTVGHVSRAYQFVGYVAGLAGTIAFVVTLAIANHFAKKKQLDERVPAAKQIR